MKARIPSSPAALAAVLLLFSRVSTGSIEPVTSVEAGRKGSPPYLLERVSVGDYTVATASLATGRSRGESALGLPITCADNFDLNDIASRQGTSPAWTITRIGGRPTWSDTNGDNPDFFVFEAGMNDSFAVEAILAGGTAGGRIVIDSSNWGYTGLNRIGFYSWDQPIGGVAFAITDLLDASGAHLTNDSVIEGINIYSPTLDPALFAAVIPEPATVLLLGLGGLLMRKRNRP